MKWTTPSFWYRSLQSRTPVVEYGLTPLSWLYRFGRFLHTRWATPQKISAPIICIGNLTVGGAGKTPTAMALMRLIKAHGGAKTPMFLTRGYGGQLTGPTLVKSLHTYQHVGDEALLLAKHAPTIVAKNRVSGASYATDHGADLIIMDDGFQNPSIHKNINIVVMGGATGLGNQKIFPAGPLREELNDGLDRADMFVITGKDERGVQDILPTHKPCYHTRFETTNPPDQNTPYLAFCGLGYPQKFFDYLARDLQLNLAETISFPDHHPYTEKDLQHLKERAQSIGATLITTEKDMVRVPQAFKQYILTVSIDLVFDHEQALADNIQTMLGTLKP